MEIKINDEFRYISSKPDVDSFDFTVFQIHEDNPRKVDIIINRKTKDAMYKRVNMDELFGPNVIKI